MAEIGELYNEFVYCKRDKISPKGAVQNISDHLGRSIGNDELSELIYFLMDIIKVKDKKISEIMVKK
jgi:hypothetical protein